MGEFTSVLRVRESVEQWCELLVGSMEVNEARVFLGDDDLWAVPGLGIKQYATFNLVTVVRVEQFDAWVRSRFNGEKLEAYDSARVLGDLTKGADRMIVYVNCSKCGGEVADYGSFGSFGSLRPSCTVCGTSLYDDDGNLR